MQYFDETEDRATRQGKMSGDVFAALVCLFVIMLMGTVVVC